MKDKEELIQLNIKKVNSVLQREREKSLAFLKSIIHEN